MSRMNAKKKEGESKKMYAWVGEKASFRKPWERIASPQGPRRVERLVRSKSEYCRAGGKRYKERGLYR